MRLKGCPFALSGQKVAVIRLPTTQYPLLVIPDCQSGPYFEDTLGSVHMTGRIQQAAYMLDLGKSPLAKSWIESALLFRC